MSSYCLTSLYAQFLFELLGKKKGNIRKYKKELGGGSWVAQWLSISAFGSGCDPRVLGWSPTSPPPPHPPRGNLLLPQHISLPLSMYLS